MKPTTVPLRARFRFAGAALAAACGLSLLAQTIPNPSFEADTFTGWPGYISGNTATAIP
jgi:hypothetical protein